MRQEGGTDMHQPFPVDREEKRQALLQAVDSVRDILAAGADEAETSERCPRHRLLPCVTLVCFG